MIVQLSSTATELFALDSEGKIWHYLNGGWERVIGPPSKKPSCMCEAASPAVRRRMAGERCGFCRHAIKAA
jgi:hypothetical protein